MCELVEVFSVAYIGGDGAAPSGKISIYDGQRGQIIYRRHKQSTCSAQNGKKSAHLPLTGPYRAISADGCVAIQFELHHGCQYRASSYVAEILIDIYDESIQYDAATTMQVKTCCCPHSPRAVVEYAILSDAVEAVVELELIRRPTGCSYVYGKIVALSAFGEVVLFESNDKNKLIGPSQGLTTIPLTRSVLAVPLELLLTIKVGLHISSTGEIVEDAVTCKPDLDSEHRLDGHNGVVQVKITCSD